MQKCLKVFLSFPTHACLSSYKCFLRTDLTEYSLPYSPEVLHSEYYTSLQRYSGYEGGWTLPLPTRTTTAGYNVQFQTCDKEVSSQLQILPLPNAQSCCPELKMTIKRVHKLTMTCLLYDFFYRKYVPPHTLGSPIQLWASFLQ